MAQDKQGRCEFQQKRIVELEHKLRETAAQRDTYQRRLAEIACRIIAEPKKSTNVERKLNHQMWLPYALLACAVAIELIRMALK